jgi:DNA-binding IclR family transcriptional regulator
LLEYIRKWGEGLKLSGGNQSVEKTMQIIEMLAKSNEPMRLSRLSREVEMPPSTVLRMLNTLVELGYAYQENEESRRYGLTLRFLHIGQMAAENFSIWNIAHPFLERVSRETGEAGCLAIKEINEVRYIDVINVVNGTLSIRQHIGGSGYLHSTGSGKLFLMQYSEKELDEYIQQGLPALTPHTLTTKRELMYELEKCRERGYAIDDQECEIGMCCVAAPLYDASQKVIASLSISGPISRMTKTRYETEIAPLLCKAANSITQLVSGLRLNPK